MERTWLDGGYVVFDWWVNIMENTFKYYARTHCQYWYWWNQRSNYTHQFLMGMDAGWMQLMLNFLEEPLQIDSSFCELKFYLVFLKSLYNDETSNMTSLNRRIKKKLLIWWGLIQISLNVNFKNFFIFLAPRERNGRGHT